MEPSHYFLKLVLTTHKKYDALRMYFVDNAPAEKVAKTFGYTCRSFTSLVTAFNKALEKETLDTLFFIRHKKGRPVSKK